MRRRLPLLLLTIALVATTPAAADLGSRKQAVDSKLAQLQSRIAAANAKEQALSAQIARTTTQIRTLEAQVGDVSSRLASLTNDLALHRARLAKLTELFELETKQLHFLQREYASALGRLNARIVGIYESDEPSTVEVLLAARSFQDLLDQLDYLGTIARQDERIAQQVDAAKQAMHAARERTKKVKLVVESETHVIEVRAAQQVQLRDQLLATQGQLKDVRATKRHVLAATEESKQEYLHEAEGLQQVSQQLAARIQAAQSSPSTSYSPPADSSPSSSGLIWPVAGPVTSPFGMRWGRMHEGIDIGAGSGTPIHAAAAGRVIYCGWESGYGNLTVIDHGNGIATAYGHQSSIAVSCGQTVAQGQTIGYVGCTGHCFGPHLHFEVRVNGQPVDPLGYL